MTIVEGYNRESVLRERLNLFFVDKFSLPNHDYYSLLDTKGILELKAVLSDINNILTMKTTLSFIDWVSERMGLDIVAKEEAVSIAMDAKPNSNGYDAYLGYPVAYVAEVKCNVPINGGSVYGSAQRKGIEKDLDGLLKGKRKAHIMPQKCLKFFVFLDLPQVREANKHLAAVNEKFRDNVVFESPEVVPSRKDIIYGVYV